MSPAPRTAIRDILFLGKDVVVVVVVVSHIQRIGCQPEKTTLHGGQSRSWSAEQGKENKRKSRCKDMIRTTQRGEYGVPRLSLRERSARLARKFNFAIKLHYGIGAQRDISHIVSADSTIIMRLIDSNRTARAILCSILLLSQHVTADAKSWFKSQPSRSSTLAVAAPGGRDRPIRDWKAIGR